MHEVTISLDSNIRELDPFRTPTHLFQVVDDAMTIRYVCTAFTGEQQIRHARYIGQLAGRLDLLVTVSAFERVFTDRFYEKLWGTVLAT